MKHLSMSLSVYSFWPRRPSNAEGAGEVGQKAGGGVSEGMEKVPRKREAIMRLGVGVQDASKVVVIILLYEPCS